MDVVITPDSSGFYATRDIYEATALHATGKGVREVKRLGDVCYFYFEDVVDCGKLVMAYRNNELSVDAKTMVDSMRTMKDFIYNNGERR
jgi:hypothetical protein